MKLQTLIGGADVPLSLPRLAVVPKARLPWRPPQRGALASLHNFAQPRLNNVWLCREQGAVSGDLGRTIERKAVAQLLATA
jgi:hypothetical protein